MNKNHISSTKTISSTRAVNKASSHKRRLDKENIKFLKAIGLLK